MMRLVYTDTLTHEQRLRVRDALRVRPDAPIVCDRNGTVIWKRKGIDPLAVEDAWFQTFRLLDVAVRCVPRDWPKLIDPAARRAQCLEGNSGDECRHYSPANGGHCLKDKCCWDDITNGYRDCPEGLMAQEPIVSIHMPIHRRDYWEYDFIPAAIACAYLQEFPYWKLRIMDDANTTFNLEEALDTVEMWLDRSIDRDKIEYDKGAFPTLGPKRQLLLETETCPLVVNFDSDDLYLPTYLSGMVKHFDHNPSCGIVTDGPCRWYYLRSRTYSAQAQPFKGSAFFAIRMDWHRAIGHQVRYSSRRIGSDSRWARAIGQLFPIPHHQFTRSNGQILNMKHGDNLSAAGEHWRKVKDPQGQFLFEATPKELHSHVQLLLDKANGLDAAICADS